MKKLTSLLLSAVFSAGLLCTSGTLPASAAEEPLILGVNAINVTGGEGHAVLDAAAAAAKRRARALAFEVGADGGAVLRAERLDEAAHVAVRELFAGGVGRAVAGCEADGHRAARDGSARLAHAAHPPAKPFGCAEADVLVGAQTRRERADDALGAVEVAVVQRKGACDEVGGIVQSGLLS